ncbi:MAG: hypothetical protein OEQ81_09125, partial [Flavobacteriaceae bacterium]|nr:hypothetical protein [Flavobacteriaceae bacterium]
MKKLFFYVLGALFLFASCQSDELDRDEAIVLENDVILMQALNALNNYKSTTPWSTTSKSPNANQVTKNWTMKYSRGTVSFVPNSDCDPSLQFLIEGDGLGSLFGRFSLINTACFDPTTGEFLTDLLGIITTAKGDELYYVFVANTPDPDNEGFVTLRANITGGSEGGRFERASG